MGELPRTGATKPDSSVAAGAALRLAGFPCFGRHDTTPSYVSGTTFRAKYRQTTAYAATTAFKRPSSGVDPASIRRRSGAIQHVIYRRAPAIFPAIASAARNAFQTSGKSPRGHSESRHAAVKALMSDADTLRIPAITVASGPMTVKIKKRHAVYGDTGTRHGPHRGRIASRFHKGVTAGRKQPGKTAPPRCHE